MNLGVTIALPNNHVQNRVTMFLTLRMKTTRRINNFKMMLKWSLVHAPPSTQPHHCHKVVRISVTTKGKGKACNVDEEGDQQHHDNIEMESDHPPPPTQPCHCKHTGTTISAMAKGKGKTTSKPGLYLMKQWKRHNNLATKSWRQQRNYSMVVHKQMQHKSDAP